MRQVQEALKGIGIPVIAGIWRATSEDQNPPLQYVVYSSTTTETAFQDDRPAGYRTYIYLNLWSDIDPTDMANRIRQAMYDADFWMLEESDKGYSLPTTRPRALTPCNGPGSTGRRHCKMRSVEKNLIPLPPNDIVQL